MDSERFNNVLDEQVARINNVLKGKAVEYASDVDRLANFKQAAHLQTVTPEEALAGMMAKHTVSINNMIAGGKPDAYSLAQWDEKITDNINYLILLRALVIERTDEEVPQYHPQSINPNRGI